MFSVCSNVNIFKRFNLKCSILFKDLLKSIVYKTHANSSTAYYETFGRWNYDDGLIDERSTRILSKRRRDLKGRVVSVSMVLTNNDSMNHLTDYRYLNMIQNVLSIF